MITQKIEVQRPGAHARMSRSDSPTPRGSMYRRHTCRAPARSRRPRTRSRRCRLCQWARRNQKNRSTPARTCTARGPRHPPRSMTPRCTAIRKRMSRLQSTHSLPTHYKVPAGCCHRRRMCLPRDTWRPRAWHCQRSTRNQGQPCSCRCSSERRGPPWRHRGSRHRACMPRRRRPTRSPASRSRRRPQRGPDRAGTRCSKRTWTARQSCTYKIRAHVIRAPSRSCTTQLHNRKTSQGAPHTHGSIRKTSYHARKYSRRYRSPHHALTHQGSTSAAQTRAPRPTTHVHCGFSVIDEKASPGTVMSQVTYTSDFRATAGTQGAEFPPGTL
jgi:hypothetical protein